MLKKIVAVGLCAVIFMACETVLDPTNPDSIKKYFAKMEPPVQMNNDKFVGFVSSGDTASMNLFLVFDGKFLNGLNDKGNSALSVAVNKRNVAMIKYLLAHGADVGIKSEQLALSPLEDASTRQDTTGIFGMLVEAQKKKDPEMLNIGLALHLAARYGMVRNVEALVESGANPNAKNSEGNTPLHEAAKEGRNPVVEYLISKNVDINPLDKEGYTPIDWAEAGGEGSTYPETAKILKAAGGKHTDIWKKSF